MEIILSTIAATLLASTAWFYKESIKSKSSASNTQNLINDAKSALLVETGHKDQALQELNKTNTQLALAQQENRLLQEQMNDWQQTKEQHLTAAKASMLEASKEMSNKLLDDHKRESKSAKEDSEKRVKQTTEELNKQFQGVFESMKSLRDQVSESRSTVDIVRQSLLNPSGAGSLSEITLENIFKNSHLVPEQDYFLQHWISSETGGLKPDAVVYLPGNNVMVVDSKASKFFLELGEANSDDERKHLESKLKDSMNQHLKDLIKRDYKQAIEDQLKANEKFVDSHNATVFMFIPTEAALENLRRIDSNFLNNAWKQRIMPVGPTGLVNALLQAEIIISNSRQNENTQIIVTEVKALLNSIATLYSHAEGVGKGLKSSIKKYDAFAASFNRSFMSKAKKLEALGISDSKTKNLPALDRFSIVDTGNLIDGESQLTNEAPQLELEEA